MSIKLTWLGHSCFVVEYKGYKVLFDPYYPDTVPGLGKISAKVDEVICSHQHADHGAKDIIDIVPSGAENPFEIEVIDSWHDDHEGEMRGANKIHILKADGMKIIHFGDIGCMPTEEQVERLKGADAVMVPVGGFFTMEPDQVAELMQEIQPTVVIPMHYRSNTYGYEKIGIVFAYTDLVDDVKVYETNTIEITKDMPVQTALLAYRGSEL